MSRNTLLNLERERENITHKLKISKVEGKVLQKVQRNAEENDGIVCLIEW